MAVGVFLFELRCFGMRIALDLLEIAVVKIGLKVVLHAMLGGKW